jgi:hypothetical protein
MRGNIMSRKITAAIVGSCARPFVKRWALQSGLQEWEAAVLAWLAGAAVSAIVLRV